MLRRLKNRFQFSIERLLLRGAHYRLFVLATLCGLVSVGAGGLVLALEGGFSGLGEAVWWAFLRLTDPGYLGDDQGVTRRLVSTAVTVLGYVVFMGALIAIISQWFTEVMHRLESGLTPIVQRDHVLILGWTNRTAAVVEELLQSEERVRRFLRRRGARRLNIVILAEEVDAALVQELRDTLASKWDPRHILFRTGTPLQLDHLERVDFRHAAAIIFPGSHTGRDGASITDMHVIKTLMSISRHGRDEGGDYPLLVTELFDARKLPIAVGAYRGPIEVLASDVFASQLIAQTVRHRGLSHVFNEILTGDAGNEIYIHACPQFAGMRLQDVWPAFKKAIPLGVLRPGEQGGVDVVLNPPGGYVLVAGDRLVVVSRTLADSTPPPSYEPEALQRGNLAATGKEGKSDRRLLVLGWNHTVPALMQALESYGGEAFEVDVLARVPLDEREQMIESHGLQLDYVRLSHHLGDYTVPTVLERMDPSTYDNVLLLGSDRFESESESDAQTLTGYLLLLELLKDAPGGPEVLVELMDPKNMELFRRRRADMLVSPLIMSHMLAQVALRPELRKVLDELFGPGGAEIFFRPVGFYELANREVSFTDIQLQVARQGETALGLHLESENRNPGGGVYLNPERGRRWALGENDEVVVLSTY